MRYKKEHIMLAIDLAVGDIDKRRKRVISELESY